jgi:hypothetical protein
LKTAVLTEREQARRRAPLPDRFAYRALGDDQLRRSIRNECLIKRLAYGEPGAFQHAPGREPQRRIVMNDKDRDHRPDANARRVCAQRPDPHPKAVAIRPLVWGAGRFSDSAVIPAVIPAQTGIRGK